MASSAMTGIPPCGAPEGETCQRRRFVQQQLGFMGSRTLDDALFDALLAAGGIGDAAGLPGLTAGIDAILNVCPPAVASRLLVEYCNRL